LEKKRKAKKEGNKSVAVGLVVDEAVVVERRYSEKKSAQGRHFEYVKLKRCACHLLFRVNLRRKRRQK